MEKTIKVNQDKKSSTMRVSESTKRELESFGRAGETHEQILKKLLKILSFQKSQTQVDQKGNVIGTKYYRNNKTLVIEAEKKKYAIVCSYNDVSSIILKKLHGSSFKEWELDLEIINIGVDPNFDKYGNLVVGWDNPKKFSKKELRLLHLIALKQILEETFDIKIFEISTLKDYFDLDKWKKAYQRNDLSMESFYNDIQKELR